MKTKIKRHSRAVLSVALAVCMLVSCMTVGIIATDAANVTKGSAVSPLLSPPWTTLFVGSQPPHCEDPQRHK